MSTPVRSQRSDSADHVRPTKGTTTTTAPSRREGDGLRTTVHTREHILRTIVNRSWLLLALVFCACGAERTQPAASSQPRASGPRDGGTLYRRLEADVSTLNPIVAMSGYDRYVANYLFTPLIHFDRELQPAPALATSWEINADGTRYRFKLDPRATFADGTPVRASDVVFTLRRIADPKSGAVQIAGAFELLDLANTRAVDAHTVDVAFRERLATQLTSFHDVFVLPEHVYGKGNFRDDFQERAIGSGPYRLVRRDIGKEIRLERRNDYWGARPHIQTIVFKIVSDHTTAFNALTIGELDETRITSDRWLRDRNDPALTRAIDFRAIYTLNYNVIAWNNEHPILKDAQVRRALAMCVPLETIVRDLFGGSARPVTGPFTPDEWACNPAVKPVPYDPAGARQMLAARGFGDRDGDGILDRGGRPLTFDFVVIAGNTATLQLGQMLQAEWKKIGVNAEIVTLDGAAAIQRVIAGNYAAAYLAWDLDPDPDPYALFHSSQVPPRGQNIVRYAKAEVDHLIERARRELQQPERQALYWRLHELLAADQPYTWTVQVTSKWALSKRLRGVETSRTTGLFSWYPGELGWWLAADTPTRVAR